MGSGQKKVVQYGRTKSQRHICGEIEKIRAIFEDRGKHKSAVKKRGIGGKKLNDLSSPNRKRWAEKARWGVLQKGPNGKNKKEGEETRGTSKREKRFQGGTTPLPEVVQRKGGERLLKGQR